MKLNKTILLSLAAVGVLSAGGPKDIQAFLSDYYQAEKVVCTPSICTVTKPQKTDVIGDNGEQFHGKADSLVLKFKEPPKFIDYSPQKVKEEIDKVCSSVPKGSVKNCEAEMKKAVGDRAMQTILVQTNELEMKNFEVDSGKEKTKIARFFVSIDKRAVQILGKDKQGISIDDLTNHLKVELDGIRSDKAVGITSQIKSMLPSPTVQGPMAAPGAAPIASIDPEIQKANDLILKMYGMLEKRIATPPTDFKLDVDLSKSGAQDIVINIDLGAREKGVQDASIHVDAKVKNALDLVKAAMSPDTPGQLLLISAGQSLIPGSIVAKVDSTPLKKIHDDLLKKDAEYAKVYKEAQEAVRAVVGKQKIYDFEYKVLLLEKPEVKLVIKNTKEAPLMTILSAGPQIEKFISIKINEK